MSLAEARDWASRVPWREVRWREAGSQMDRHWYVISDWPEVDLTDYWRFVRTIKQEGYKGSYVAPYRPGDVMVNDYLEIDDWCYWAIPPKQACRTRIAFGQHERLPEQLNLNLTNPKSPTHQEGSYE